MKKFNIKIVGVAFIAFAVIFVFAATEQWRFPVTLKISQIVADEYGGCAFSAMETNGFVTIYWLDKKGNAKYISEPAPGFVPGIIQACSKKQLTYMVVTPMPLIVQVNKKGDEKPIASLGGYMYGFPPPTLGFNHGRLIDKKGFFVFNVETNVGFNSVVRYSYK